MLQGKPIFLKSFFVEGTSITKEEKVVEELMRRMNGNRAPPTPAPLPPPPLPPEPSKKKKKRRKRKKVPDPDSDPVSVPDLTPVPDPPQPVPETDTSSGSSDKGLVLLAPANTVKGEPTPYLQRGKWSNIGAFYGYDQIAEKYAIKYEGDDTMRWLRKDYFHDTDPKWLEIAKNHGMPSFDRDSKSFKPLVGGVVTRRQLAASFSSGRTSGVPVEYNDGGILCCLTASYLNLAGSVLIKIWPSASLN